MSHFSIRISAIMFIFCCFMRSFSPNSIRTFEVECILLLIWVWEHLTQRKINKDPKQVTKPKEYLFVLWTSIYLFRNVQRGASSKHPDTKRISMSQMKINDAPSKVINEQQQIAERETIVIRVQISLHVHRFQCEIACSLPVPIYNLQEKRIK